MTTTNITNFRKNAFDYVEQTIKYNQPINITTKDGNAVLLSEEDYSGIMETLYRSLHRVCAKRLWTGIATPLEDCGTKRRWSGKCTRSFTPKPPQRTRQN